MNGLRYKSTWLPLIVLLSAVSLACEPVTDSQAQSDLPPYASEEPITEASLFGEGTISTGDYELNAVFSPDGRTLYFSKSTPDSRFSLMTILASRFENGAWGTPEVASFSGQYTDVDPALSPDGSRIFFISKRPIEDMAPKDDFDIWTAEQTDAGWSTPERLGAPINTDANEYYPGVTRDGTLYFSARREGGQGNYDLYRSRRVNGQYTEPENLGEAVNSESAEIDLFVAPDERYIIFVSYRQEGQGRGDLYISYNQNGTWTPAQNLGDKVNTSAREYTPLVSPDGRYLFFTSERGFADEPLKEPLTYDELIQRIRGPGNGMGDIYRIELSALGLDL